MNKVSIYSGFENDEGIDLLRNMRRNGYSWTTSPPNHQSVVYHDRRPVGLVQFGETGAHRLYSLTSFDPQLEKIVDGGFKK